MNCIGITYTYNPTAYTNYSIVAPPSILNGYWICVPLNEDERCRWDIDENKYDFMIVKDDVDEVTFSPYLEKIGRVIDAQKQAGVIPKKYSNLYTIRRNPLCLSAQKTEQ